VAFLRAQPARRVQDPAASLAVESTRGLSPQSIIDYCAGRGTKTRQLAALHPGAQVIASDPDPDRLADLRATALGLPNVRALEPKEMGALPPRRGDLLLLDVPCSNTGVLARRPEARYRFSNSSLRSVVALQRRIIDSALPLLRPGGHILYSTCSLEEEENRQQVRWLCTRHKAVIVQETCSLPSPGSDDVSYHDGGYFALLRVQ
jgi:16S rRNA (cytosine967-C5)-methyltransferase